MKHLMPLIFIVAFAINAKAQSTDPNISCPPGQQVVAHDGYPCHFYSCTQYYSCEEAPGRSGTFQATGEGYCNLQLGPEAYRDTEALADKNAANMCKPLPAARLDSYTNTNNHANRSGKDFCVSIAFYTCR